MDNLKNLIDSLGVSKVADLCGISVRAVYKWRASNSLPRTEYTGETRYSDLLSHALNNAVTAEEIRNFSNPIKSSQTFHMFETNLPQGTRNGTQ